ncbi:MAG TPA: metallophosphoesterase family protein, partial [Candidatus Methylomirabilis sp.]|nr:metallophosphoesterase family protein [Candidatus Methylomirabilis sp.]
MGLISDTHGLLRPEAIRALQGSDLIIHAGDVGKEAVLTDLQVVAPVTAVRGNVDREVWAHRLPRTEALEIEQVRVYVIHDVKELDLIP